MSCTNPLLAVDLGIKDNGKRKIKILPRRYDQSLAYLTEKYGDRLLRLPCGHCLSCKLDYSKSWSLRIILEASKYKQNCFVTLTYDDNNLPDKASKRDFQLFIKRLRKVTGNKIKYFGCGEYGSKEKRFHIHIIIFNYDFTDRTFYKRSKGGFLLYTSLLLDTLWGKGIATVQDVTLETAGYVARYSMKKQFDTSTPGDEYILMSRKPALGLKEFDYDIYETDKIYFQGSHKVPRIYDKYAEQDFNPSFEAAKYDRIKKASFSPGIVLSSDIDEDITKRDKLIMIDNANLLTR